MVTNDSVFWNSYFVILWMRKIQCRIIQNNNIIILNFPALPSAKSKRAGIFINFLWFCIPSFFINTLLPITFLVEGENWKKREVNPPCIYIEHRCLIFPNIFAEIFFGDLSDIFFFLPIIWTNVGCKKCNLSIQYILPSTQKGCHMAKNGQ